MEDKKEYIESTYSYHKRVFADDCRLLAENLLAAAKRVEKDWYHGNPMSSSLPNAISERYSSLKELYDLLEEK